MNPFYLAGGYPIIQVFVLTAFFTAWNIIADIFRNRRKKAAEPLPRSGQESERRDESAGA